MTRTFAIGGVHGCLKPLWVLAEAVPLRPCDTLVMLDDDSSRGPDSRGVIEWLCNRVDVERPARVPLGRRSIDATSSGGCRPRLPALAPLGRGLFEPARMCGLIDFRTVHRHSRATTLKRRRHTPVIDSSPRAATHNVGASTRKKKARRFRRAFRSLSCCVPA